MNDEESKPKITDVHAFRIVDTPRESLISALAAATTREHGEAIVDALDAYMAEPIHDRTLGLSFVKPSPQAEIDRLRKELEEALARAERAERKE